MTPSELESLSGMTAEEAANKLYPDTESTFMYKDGSIENKVKGFIPPKERAAYVRGRSDQAALDGYKITPEMLNALYRAEAFMSEHNKPLDDLLKILESKQSGK